MPVLKFRSFEDARRALWTAPGDPALLERLRRLGELARPRRHPTGVFRYRSIEEAKAETALVSRSLSQRSALDHGGVEETSERNRADGGKSRRTSA